MKRANIVKLLLAVIFVAFCGVVIATISWFVPLVQIQASQNPIKGITEGAYFAYGDGLLPTQENPSHRKYGISKPRHLYNLAWLQYLGFFNSEGIQYSFELADDIDMDGWILPPIGTEEYPFVGSFDGKGHVISNLTISNNYSDFDKHPSSVKDPNSTTGIPFDTPHILGFFGVIGNLDGAFSTNAYKTSSNTFENTGLSNLLVNSVVQDSLIGLAAGYVDAKISTVAVQSGSIDLNLQGNTTATAYRGTGNNKITSNVSDYSIVGFTKHELSINKVNETIYDLDISPNHEFYASTDGGDNGWGGSINMAELHGRLASIYNTASSATYTYEQTITSVSGSNSTTNSLTANAKMYHPTSNNDKKIGSFVFNRTQNNGNSTQYYYLGGGKKVNNINLQFTTGNGTGYYIQSGSNYLTISYSNGSYQLANTTNIQSAICWTFSTNPTNAANNATTTISTTIENTTYYLACATSTTYNNYVDLSLQSTNNSSNNTFTFNVSGTNRKLFRAYYNRRYYDAYIYLNGTNWRAYSVRGNNNSTTHPSAPTNSTNLTFSSGTRNSLTRTESTSIDYSGTAVTYFPLTVKNYSSGDYTAATGSVSGESKNTGYIIGGRGDTTTSGTYPYKSGDIRVSYYAKSSNLSNISNVYTIRTNRNQDALSSDEKNALDRFTTTYNNFRDKAYNYNTTNVYGLHFMNSKISTQHLVTADWAYMNQYENNSLNEHTNFQLPASCIDFSLLGAGYIKFFAGTYFTGNNSFFSLHQITRNSDSTIQSIKKIDTIYANKNEPTYSYVYKLVDEDGTIEYTKAFEYITTELGERITVDLDYDGNLPEDYEAVFYSYQIENKTNTGAQGSFSHSNALYYFEVPVNAGEYALGSVDGGTGAYLLYLDIGANSARMQRTIITENFNHILSEYKCPEGVAIIPVTTVPNGFDDTNSICFKIESGYKGTLQIERTDNNIIVSRTTNFENKAVPNYISESIGTVKNQVGTSIKESLQSISTTTTYTQRMQYYDYGINTKSTNVTVFTDVKINNGDYTRTISQYDLETGIEVDADNIVIFDTDDGQVMTVTTRAAIPIDQSAIKSNILVNLSYITRNQIVTKEIELVMTPDELNEAGVYYIFDKYEITYDVDSGSITIKYEDLSSTTVIVIETTTLSGTTGNITVQAQ